MEEEEEAPLSPIAVTKNVRDIAASTLARRPAPPRQILLEQWWLSKPLFGHGFAVCGRRFTTYDNVSAPPKRRCPCESRQYNSQVIVKRHDHTTLETSDGVIVSLCGIINSSRSKENGFSSEVCRNFNTGFPYNWDDYAASVDEKSSQDGSCLKQRTDSFLPVDLDGYNGAQLHELVFSRSDTERELLNKKVYDDLIGMLYSQPMNEESHLPKSTPPLSQRSRLKR